jgi:urease accessory protein
MSAGLEMSGNRPQGPEHSREGVLRLERVIGNLADANIGGRVHDVEHHGTVEYLDLAGDDIRRHRLRLSTDRGSDCAIVLPRDASLRHGDVLLLEHRRAIVVRLANATWLRFAPVDAMAALELGYFAGNMHWPVRFQDGDLLVEQRGERETYIERLDFMLSAGRIREVPENDG